MQKNYPPKRKSAIIRVLRALKRQYHRHKEKETEHHKNERTIARWTARMGLFTLALVVINILTTWIFKRQLNVMQGQLDAMETDKRPWLRNELYIDKYIILSDWGGNKGVIVPLMYVLKNYGEVPAVNVRMFFAISPHPGNVRRQELDKPQQDACDQATACRQ